MEKNSRIFLLGIHTDLKKTEIIDFFKKEYPSVTNCCLIHSKKFKKKTNNVGYGTLFLGNEEEKEKILEKRQFSLKGRNFVVKPYYKGKKLKDFKSSVHKRRIYVNNINPGMENGELRKVFEMFGDIEDAYIVKNNKFEGFKRIGFVVFEKVEQAEKVIGMKSVKSSHSGTDLGVFRYKSEKTRKEERREAKKSKKGTKQKKKSRSKQTWVGTEYDVKAKAGSNKIEKRRNHLPGQKSGLSTAGRGNANCLEGSQIKIEANGSFAPGAFKVNSKGRKEENFKVSSKNRKGNPNAGVPATNKLKFNKDSPAFFQHSEIANIQNASWLNRAISAPHPDWSAHKDQWFHSRGNQFQGGNHLRSRYQQDRLNGLNGRRGYFPLGKREIIEAEREELMTKNVYETLKFVACLFDHRTSNVRFN